MADRFSANLPTGLRFELTPKHVRPELAGETLADSSSAVLVWGVGCVYSVGSGCAGVFVGLGRRVGLVVGQRFGVLVL